MQTSWLIGQRFSGEHQGVAILLVVYLLGSGHSIHPSSEILLKVPILRLYFMDFEYLYSFQSKIADFLGADLTCIDPDLRRDLLEGFK
jgi:hypothetical protein